MTSTNNALADRLPNGRPSPVLNVNSKENRIRQNGMV